MPEGGTAPLSRLFFPRPVRRLFMAVAGSLRLKLVLLMVAGTYVVFSAVFFYAYHTSRKILLKNIELNARALTDSTAQEIKTTLRIVEKIPDFLARRLAYRRYTVDEIRDLQRDFIEGIPEANGCAVAYEPYRYDPQRRYFAPYFADLAGRKVFRLLEGPSYDYFTKDWYRQPKKLNQAVWSEPYFDKGGGNFAMVTYSVPFYRVEEGKRVFNGVVTVDMSLFWLQSIMSQVSMAKGAFAVIVSREGRFIAHRNPDRIMKPMDAESVESRDAPRFADLAARMKGGEKGFVRLSSRQSEKNFWVYFAPLPRAGWSMALVVPERELFADIDSLFREVIEIGSAGFVLFLVMVVLLSNTVIRPLNELSAAAVRIAEGDLDAPLPVVATTDEIGVLSGSFTEMRASLKRYIDNLAEVTAVRERIESELKIARSIQMSFLPARTPFSRHAAVEIFAELEPAREVGGDLYDYFLLDDRHLFVAIGDVSDKGAPAALFMAVASALLKAEARKGAEPAALLRTVNREICNDNQSCMFVTLFCGVLDLLSGEFRYANAGHPPPILIAEDSPPSPINVFNGCALGIQADAEYLPQTLLLHPGDALLLYTDGVTEAMNRQHSLFGVRRLVDAVSLHPPVTAEMLVKKVLYAVREHEAGAQASDDVALLALRFRGDRQGGMDSAG